MTKFSDKELTFSDVKRIVSDRLGVIIGSIIIFVFSFLLYSLATWPVYEAKGSIQLSSVSTNLGVASEFFQLVGGGGSQLNSEVEILRSRSIIDSVIQQHGLSVEILDYTRGDPFSRALFFMFNDRFKRDLRAIRVKDVSFPPESWKKKYFLSFTDDKGSFVVRGPAGELGSGTINQPFKSESISFTVTYMKGPKGTRFRLVPIDPFRTRERFTKKYMVSPLGEASRTNLIQVRFRANEPTLAADVVNSAIKEYEDRNLEWKTKQGNAQTVQIEMQLNETLAKLKEAEDKLEKYQNEHGVVALPEEASLIVKDLAIREAQKVDLELKTSVLQGIYSSLEGQVDAIEFPIPPTLTQDMVIQQLASDHARLMVELNTLLLDYTEAHPLVVSKRQQIKTVRESILGVIDSTVKGLIKQRKDLEKVTSDLENKLYNVPGVERILLEMTRARDVADEAFRLLMKRKSEAQLIQAGLAVGNRIIDEAIPPERHAAPRIGLNSAIGIGLGFVLGLLLAFIMNVFDPKIRSREEIENRLIGIPVKEIKNESQIAEASSLLALAALRSENKILSMIQLGAENDLVRDRIADMVASISISLQPLLLIDASTVNRQMSFFEIPSEPGLSELASGTSFQLRGPADLPVLVLPPGRIASSAHVSSENVRNQIEQYRQQAAFTLINAPNQIAEPAMRGWNVIAGDAILVIAKNQDLRQNLDSMIINLQMDKIRLLGVIVVA